MTIWKTREDVTVESQVPHREEIEGARKFWEKNQVQGAWELCLLSEWVVTLHIVGYVCAMNEPKHFYPAISGGTGSSDPLHSSIVYL